VTIGTLEQYSLFLETSVKFSLLSFSKSILAAFLTYFFVERLVGFCK
jgi:hypothetical protein